MESVNSPIFPRSQVRIFRNATEAILKEQSQKSACTDPADVDLSTMGPLTLKIHRVLKEGDSVISALVEVIAEPSITGSRSSSWGLCGWPIR